MYYAIAFVALIIVIPVILRAYYERYDADEERAAANLDTKYYRPICSEAYYGK